VLDEMIQQPVLSGEMECQEGTNISLAVTTLSVCVMYIVVFEHQKQVLFNMTRWYTSKNVVFGMLKASCFSI
jgi:hypothetical protein